MSLSIDDLRVLHTLAVKAKNEARAAAESAAGADFLRALHIDGSRAQPSLGIATQARLDRADKASDLAVRVGQEVDARLVATDPGGTLYPAARDRVRERQAAATVEP